MIYNLFMANKKSIQYGACSPSLKSCAESIDLNLVEKCDIIFYLNRQSNITNKTPIGEHGREISKK